MCVDNKSTAQALYKVRGERKRQLSPDQPIRFEPQFAAQHSKDGRNGGDYCY